MNPQVKHEALVTALGQLGDFEKVLRADLANGGNPLTALIGNSDRITRIQSVTAGLNLMIWELEDQMNQESPDAPQS